MIIFGTRAKTKTVGEGEFFCPHCHKERQYERKAMRNHFALYFIPLFPIGETSEFIECQRCHRTYGLDVLNFHPAAPPQNDAARMLNNIKAKLEKGQSVEYVVGDLTMEGLDRDIAGNMVTMVTGGRVKTCSGCGLTYAASVQRCRECGTAL